jgi:hypothetical protein
VSRLKSWAGENNNTPLPIWSFLGVENVKIRKKWNVLFKTDCKEKIRVTY